MQWFGKGSNNVDDRRGGGLAIGGGLGVVIIILGLIFGQDFTSFLGDIPVRNSTIQEPNNATEDKDKQFVSGVLESTEIVWADLFARQGIAYQQPKLTLFTGRVQSACGGASAAVGPFYCPADYRIYIDLSFFEELSSRFGAQGDFAQAYVIAHEVGHHVQNLLGTTDKMVQARSRLSEVEYNKLSVKLELQADFFAGIWAHHVQKLELFKLDPGDFEEALIAANAIGDDKLQQNAGREIMPDNFTHGTSQQRMFWFKKGLETGQLTGGNTF